MNLKSYFIKINNKIVIFKETITSFIIKSGNGGNCLLRKTYYNNIINEKIIN